MKYEIQTLGGSGCLGCLPSHTGATVDPVHSTFFRVMSDDSQLSLYTQSGDVEIRPQMDGIRISAFCLGKTALNLGRFLGINYFLLGEKLFVLGEKLLLLLFFQLFVLGRIGLG